MEADKGKKILITVYDSVVAKNLLRTSVLDELLASGARVIILPPANRAEIYKKEFESYENVEVEMGEFWIYSHMREILANIFLYSIPTRFMRIRQVDRFWNKGKYFHYLFVSTLRILGRFRLVKWKIRMFEKFLPTPSVIKRVYDKWQPDLVFCTTMIDWREYALLNYAKKKGSKTVGMVKSWDNLTSKAFMRVFPDKLIVHQKIQVEEAVNLYRYPREQIIVTGLPQFDEYLDSGFVDTRENFFAEMKLDLDKKLILFAPAGDWMTPHDKEVLAMMLGWIDGGKLGNTQILLRLHPAYESRTEELAGASNLVVERPGTILHKGGEKLQFELDRSDARHLATSIYHSNVTINSASTMTIEAAVFGKPVILIGFDGDTTEEYWNSVIRYYDREHYVPIIETGGAPLVKSKEKFLETLQRYLKDPTIHKEGRKRIVEQQCYKLDGQSGKRVASAVMSTL